MNLEEPPKLTELCKLSYEGNLNSIKRLVEHEEDFDILS